MCWTDCLLFTDSPRNVTVRGNITVQPNGLIYVAQYDTLVCNAVCYPASTYQWQWNDGTSNRFAVGQTLTVTDIGLRNYTCITTNCIGSASAVIHVGVVGEFGNIHFSQSTPG